jgi:hypothetical protein
MLVALLLVPSLAQAEHRLFPSDVVGDGAIDVSVGVTQSRTSRSVEANGFGGVRVRNSVWQDASVRYGLDDAWEVGAGLAYSPSNVLRTDFSDASAYGFVSTAQEGRGNPSFSLGRAFLGGQDSVLSLKGTLQYSPAVREGSHAEILADVTGGWKLADDLGVWSQYSHARYQTDNVGAGRSIAVGVFKGISENVTLTGSIRLGRLGGGTATNGNDWQTLSLGGLIRLAPNTYLEPSWHLAREGPYDTPASTLSARPMNGRSLSFSVYHLLDGAARPSASGADSSGSDRTGFSVRFWRSKGNTSWSHCASTACVGGTYTILGRPVGLGDPTSRLDASDLTADSAELFATLAVGREWILSGSFGLGATGSGKLRDRDWLDLRALGFGAQSLWSDTMSKVRDGRLDYYSVDLGRIWQGERVAATPFLGFARHIETYNSYGVAHRADDVGQAATRTDIPDSVEAFSHKVRWLGLRLGVDLACDLSDSDRLTVNAAYLPWAEGKLDDSHHLRPDMGPTPNAVSAAKGNGWMLDFIGRHRFSSGPLQGWDGQFGYRYWVFESRHGYDWTGPAFSQPAPLRTFRTERRGILVGLGYRF